MEKNNNSNNNNDNNNLDEGIKKTKLNNWRARYKNGLSDDFWWLFNVLGSFGFFHSYTVVHSK